MRFELTNEAGEVIASSEGSAACLAKSFVLGKSSAPESPAELVAEHEHLVDVLRSPSHKDDLEEAAKQEAEISEYRDEMGKSHVAAHTRKDGVFVNDYYDKRQKKADGAAHPGFQKGTRVSTHDGKAGTVRGGFSIPGDEDGKDERGNHGYRVDYDGGGFGLHGHGDLNAEKSDDPAHPNNWDKRGERKADMAGGEKPFEGEPHKVGQKVRITGGPNKGHVGEVSRVIPNAGIGGKDVPAYHVKGGDGPYGHGEVEPVDGYGASPALPAHIEAAVKAVAESSAAPEHKKAAIEALMAIAKDESGGDAPAGEPAKAGKPMAKALIFVPMGGAAELLSLSSGR